MFLHSFDKIVCGFIARAPWFIKQLKEQKLLQKITNKRSPELEHY